ncbi:hypothetical protein [Haloplasma contractile]|uniref:Uncharacterized protein n=1 Tax=Haloplasma contractile SSD-17B TaxID=1033810 RepID=U2E8W1_9MOLU|nr:hypothetical protein [Haloplasma contractile]ERJ11578.1 hypothetical protein HLPCO_002279 [Haloplasma contractile SSD-17B]
MDIKSLVFGFVLGIIFILIVTWIVIVIANHRFVKKSIKASKINNGDVKKQIKKKQNKIIKSTKLGVTHNVELMHTLTKELIFEIAEYYYPNSKYPHLEISLIEALDLNEKITERLKHLLEIKGIGILKRIRLSQVVTILEIKKNIEDNTVYKFSKKYNLDKVVKYGYSALNVANPAYWVRKLIYTSTLETSIRSVSAVALNIIGEEAMELYSKKVIPSNEITEEELERVLKEIA